MKSFLPWVLLAAIVIVPITAVGQDQYKLYMDQCNRAKQAGNFAAMEVAVVHALRHGPGDEYAWRTLAWAQARQGKWRPSLANAQQNVKRHGVSGWSLAQFADSALGMGDFELARKTLQEADALPRATMNGADVALRDCQDRLRAATEYRTYQLEIRVDLKQGGAAQKPAWLLIPQTNTDQQTFTFVVKNVVSWKPRRVENRDYIEVVQKPGEAFSIEGKLVLKPFCLGTKLDQITAADEPQEFKPYLGKFQNWSWWDPAMPEVAAIARTLKGKTDAETAQNVLNWFRRNIRYDATIKDDPALGQLGTILKLRRGGCHHNSGLFVTLCRAAGVPACVGHGVVLPMHTQPFEMSHPITGHGWAEVYLHGLGWVPVEPTDADSLRLFSANRAFLAFGASNRPADNHHFASSITYEGTEYRLFGLSSFTHVSGRLLAGR